MTDRNQVAGPTVREQLEQLAIRYHKEQEGEYGCNGRTCPGVQRLIVFASAARALPQADPSAICGASPNTPDVGSGHHCTRRKQHDGPHRVCCDGDLWAEWDDAPTESVVRSGRERL